MYLKSVMRWLAFVFHLEAPGSSKRKPGVSKCKPKWSTPLISVQTRVSLGFYYGLSTPHIFLNYPHLPPFQTLGHSHNQPPIPSTPAVAATHPILSEAAFLFFSNVYVSTSRFQYMIFTIHIPHHNDSLSLNWVFLNKI